MHTRAAKAPPGDPVGLKAAILSDPSIVEKGLRILDADLRAGTSGSIDLIGIDRAGALVLIAIAADEPGATLLRLLDQHQWMADQRDLLARAYSESGMAPRLPVRCLLLAPCFTHAFLQRLSLLTVDVFPYLARRGRTRGGAWLIEPAAPIFGFGQREEESGAASDPPARLLGVPETDTAAAGVGHGGARDGGAPDRAAAAGGAPDSGWPGEAPPHGEAAAGGPLDGGAEQDRADEGGPQRDRAGDGEADRASIIAFEDMPSPAEPLEPLPGIPLASEAGPIEVLETLTTEELEEFERFDRQRREGQRGAS